MREYRHDTIISIGSLFTKNVENNFVCCQNQTQPKASCMVIIGNVNDSRCYNSDIHIPYHIVLFCSFANFSVENVSINREKQTLYSLLDSETFITELYEIDTNQLGKVD